MTYLTRWNRMYLSEFARLMEVHKMTVDHWVNLGLMIVDRDAFHVYVDAENACKWLIDNPGMHKRTKARAREVLFMIEREESALYNMIGMIRK